MTVTKKHQKQTKNKDSLAMVRGSDFFSNENHIMYINTHIHIYTCKSAVTYRNNPDPHPINKSPEIENTKKIYFYLDSSEKKSILKYVINDTENNPLKTASAETSCAPGARRLSHPQGPTFSGDRPC